jgi:hypothetical protein
MDCNLIACVGSHCPKIRSSPPNCATSSGFALIRLTMPSYFQFGSWQNPLILGSLCLNVILGTLKSAGPQTVPPLRLFACVAEKLPKEDADILWRVYRGRENEIADAQVDYDRAPSNNFARASGA